MKCKVCMILAMICVLAFAGLTLTSGITADHDCAGEHCAVCLCSNMLKLAAGAFLASVGTAAVILLRSNSGECADALEHHALQTPVCLKVKLSD